MVIETKFNIGDRVFFNNKIGRDEGVVCGFLVDVSFTVLYEVVWSNKDTRKHYEFELTK